MGLNSSFFWSHGLLFTVDCTDSSAFLFIFGVYVYECNACTKHGDDTVWRGGRDYVCVCVSACARMFGRASFSCSSERFGRGRGVAKWGGDCFLFLFFEGIPSGAGISNRIYIGAIFFRFQLAKPLEIGLSELIPTNSQALRRPSVIKKNI